MRDVIPDDVLREIQAHIHTRIRHAEEGWDAGSDEEDTLTGDLGGSLRTPGWVESAQNGNHWRWRISYKKFRGRGGNAPESITGADGIFQVEVRPGIGPVEVVKGLLFQGKKYRGSARGDLMEQVTEMEQTAPGGSAVFEFSPNGYKAASGRSILERRKRQPAQIPHPEATLDGYLADQFLPCTSGLRGMYYDAVRGILVVPMENGEVKFVQVSLRHRIALQVRRKY